MIHPFITDNARIARATHPAMRCLTCGFTLRIAWGSRPGCTLCGEGREYDHVHAACDHCDRWYAYADGRRVA